MPKTNGAKRAYGCVFCVTGKEQVVAQHMEQTGDDIRAIVARQSKRKTVQGKTNVEEAVLFPGYVFFDAPEDTEITQKFSNRNVLSILTSETGDWRLYGGDAEVVQWLFSYNGLLTLSEAYQEGDRIRIIAGPLKGLEGQIIRIVKRDRSAQVAIPFCNRVSKVWLGFEIVEKNQ